MLDKFCYSTCFISLGIRITDELQLGIQKTRSALVDLKGMWHRRDIPLSIEHHVYAAVARCHSIGLRIVAIVDNRCAVALIFRRKSIILGHHFLYDLL